MKCLKRKKKAIVKRARSVVNEVYRFVLARYDNDSIEESIHHYSNLERVKDGKKPLMIDYNATLTSINRNKEMIADGKISHEGFYDDAYELMELGIDKVGENIAYGYGTGKAVVRGWMNSPGHRKNLLNPRYDAHGLSVLSDKNKRKYYCQTLIDEKTVL